MKMRRGWLAGLMVCSLACGSSREETCRRSGLVYDSAMARCACPAGTTLLDAGCAASDDGGPTGEDACTAQTWFADDDGDRYGIEGTTIEACSRPEGYTSQVGDCDDANASIHPGQPETCDLVDDDCDVEVSGCPDGCLAQPFGGSIYLFCQSELTWEQAAAQCESVSYRLVAIDSAGENEWLVTRATELPLSSPVWTGGNGENLGSDPDWRWPDGRVFWHGTVGDGTSGPIEGEYANWGGGEPSQSGVAAFSLDPTPEVRGRWVVPYPTTYSFICERTR